MEFCSSILNCEKYKNTWLLYTVTALSNKLGSLSVVGVGFILFLFACFLINKVYN